MELRKNFKLYSEFCPEFNPTFGTLQCLYYDPPSNRDHCGYCKKTNWSYRCLADVRGTLPLSHSTVQDFLTCHFFYYLKNLRGIRVRNAACSDALKRGKLWDSALGKFLGAKNRDGSEIDLRKIIDDYEIPALEVAKVKGIYRAYKQLELEVDPGYKIQEKIDLQMTVFDHAEWGGESPETLYLTGYYDRKYPEEFVENKLSGKPDRYLDIFFIQSQIGTYFLADPNLQSVVMEIVRTPELKQKKKGDEETPEEFQERVYQDALSRPAHYFIGYDRNKKRYGKRYFRTEFNLDELKGRFKAIFRELYEAWLLNGWYKNDHSCLGLFGPCDMLQVCRYNTLAESQYYFMERNSL